MAYAEQIDDWLYDEIDNTFNPSALFLKDGAIQSLKNEFKQLISKNGGFFSTFIGSQSLVVFFIVAKY